MTNQGVQTSSPRLCHAMPCHVVSLRVMRMKYVETWITKQSALSRKTRFCHSATALREPSYFSDIIVIIVIGRGRLLKCRMLPDTYTSLMCITYSRWRCVSSIIHPIPTVRAGVSAGCQPTGKRYRESGYQPTYPVVREAKNGDGQIQRGCEVAVWST
ncbi:predicted protein [Plenodomus lingam JN3]|uniref:Predicted protein n=1 Tax=Leptosphaeria maculans (strain JN3 / isolate v23.1.3 / race Av1-4-5-6-7-8) TaxID=985895 RepID=E4ZTV1_LEPMJ|nr:predicted protein [Plenodomus lingam JN3]CBX94661.1 predicted protein [Plenodomus lingam JN3]